MADEIEKKKNFFSGLGKEIVGAVVSSLLTLSLFTVVPDKILRESLKTKHVKQQVEAVILEKAQEEIIHKIELEPGQELFFKFKEIITGSGEKKARKHVYSIVERRIKEYFKKGDIEIRFLKTPEFPYNLNFREYEIGLYARTNGGWELLCKYQVEKNGKFTRTYTNTKSEFEKELRKLGENAALESVFKL